MKNKVYLFFLLTAFVLFGNSAETNAQNSLKKTEKSTIVIVHGAWGGSWAFKEVAGILSKQGYTVYRPSLTGLGERVHLGGPDVNLTTHINDVVNTFLFEELDNVILIGHSYGGMVITGVQDRIPDRIKHLIYLDAFLPENGESVVGMGDPSWITNNTKGDFVVPRWVKNDQKPPKDVPHPVNCFTEKMVLNNPIMASSSYILTFEEGKEAQEDSFYSAYLRAKKKGWNLYELKADHNPQWSAVTPFCELLIDIVEKQTSN